MNERKPLLMLSLPNSGSSWLAELIAANTSWNRYFMEYFNPLRNIVWYHELSKGFGCELIDCYKNIALGDFPEFDQRVRESFMASDRNFTKEVYSPLKLEPFMRHFRCFVLLREEADTFPPKRLRIWSFYEHAWWAFSRYRVLAGRTAFERARSAYRHMHGVIESDAMRLGAPIIRYRNLFDDDKACELLNQSIGECPDALMDAIRKTRVIATR